MVYAYYILAFYVIGCIAVELLGPKDQPMGRVLRWPWNALVGIARYLGALWIVLKANQRDI